MNTRQAIAAMRRLHAGGYHAKAEWVCKKRLNAPSAVQRQDASDRLLAIRDANGGSYPRPLSQEVRDFQAVVFASQTWTIGRIEGVAGLQFLAVEGQGDTLEEAVHDATRRREADRKRYSECRGKPAERNA